MSPARGLINNLCFLPRCRILCATLATRKVQCLGTQDWGRRISDAAVVVKDPVAQVATSYTFACALLVNGTVQCWYVYIRATLLFPFLCCRPLSVL